jgi:hypothetical protein
MSTNMISKNFNFSSYQNSNNLEEMEANYSLDETAQKIEKLSQSDDRVCLFIGRTGNEPLPREENAIWISGDIQFATEPYSLEERIHIWHDFTDEKGLSKFQGLFDKIVIDQSTCKALGNDFISRFARLLKPSSQSVLIFEKTPYTSCYHETIEQPKNIYSSLLVPISYLTTDQENDQKHLEEYEKNNDQSQRDDDFIAFKQQLFEVHPSWVGLFTDEDLESQFCEYIIQRLRSEHNDPTLCDKLEEWAIQDTKEHTEQIFQKVEFFEDRPYPYPTNYSKERNSFFIATGIKPKICLY